MARGRLSDVQVRALTALAAVPGWVLSGGDSLVGFHLMHRGTRDLDLFMRPDRQLDPLIIRDVEHALVAAGLECTSQVTSPHFHRWQVQFGDERTELDLVAEPTPAIEPPEIRQLGDTEILVETAHEVLTNKLCTLIGRTELRDLIDVRALLAAGLPLERALKDAASKDAGFSPLILAQLIGTMDLDRANRSRALTPDELVALKGFARELADRCVRLATQMP